MSAKNSLELAASDEVCASCGIAAIDDIKLKECGGGCNLVKYCSDNCQELHRDQHKEDCKKRKAEMRDKELFTQPNSSYMGECPICCLPLPIYMSKSTMMSCCCKYICIGCDHANQMRENEQGLEPRCAFCREPVPDSEAECIKNVMNRIKKYNDPVGMTAMGKKHYREGDYGKALEYYTKAAELGDLGAHCGLGGLYLTGERVDVEKDMTKAIYHLEQAAIGGEPFSRRLLELMKQRMAASREQPNISSLTPTLDVILHCSASKTFLLTE
jgi:hypothetical protein